MPHMHFLRTELTEGSRLGYRKGVSALWFRQEGLQQDSTDVVTPPGSDIRVGAGCGWSFLLRDYELSWREERSRERPDERQMRRKAADRKSGLPVSRFQPIGRLPEGGDEFEVEPVELLAGSFAESVETRGWRLLRPVWLCPRILPPDRIRSERLLATPLPLSFGGVFDLLDHALDLMTVLLGGEMLPAGQGLQDERFRLLETLRPRRLASLLRQVFCRPVDPDPLQRRAGEEGWRGMDAGPLTHPGHEMFLDPIREHIGKPGGLGGQLRC